MNSRYDNSSRFKPRLPLDKIVREGGWGDVEPNYYDPILNMWIMSDGSKIEAERLQVDQYKPPRRRPWTPVVVLVSCAILVLLWGLYSWYAVFLGVC